MLKQDKSITFECYFDAIGRQSSHVNKCFFEVVTEETFISNLYTNNNVIKNPSLLDMKRYKVKPIVGKLQDNDKTYTNAKIVFIKNNEKTSTFGDVVSEVCYTDNGGRYIAYIEPGIYNIEIYINNKKIIKRNQYIGNGLRFQYYLLIEGLIYRKYKDTVSFCGTDYKNIYGQLIDNKHTPIKNAEIIVLQDGELKTYVKTDEDGKYKFALKNGNYEIKIRSKQSPVKSTKICLDDLHGFSEQLNGSSILFNKNVMIKL